MEFLNQELELLSKTDINKIILDDINKEPTDEDFEKADNEKNIGYFLLKKIYNELGISKFLKEKQKKLNIDYDLNEILLFACSM